eukprot:symbB.v1.2.007962.t1/scaffold478.1/size396144/13
MESPELAELKPMVGTNGIPLGIETTSKKNEKLTSPQKEENPESEGQEVASASLLVGITGEAAAELSEGRRSREPLELFLEDLAWGAQGRRRRCSVLTVPMSQASDAETVPGDPEHRLDSCPGASQGQAVAGAEDSQPQRALWMRPLPTPAPAATPTAVAPAVPTELPLVRLPASQLVAGLPGAPRPRTYRSLRPHMQLLPERSFALPRSMLPKGASKEAEMQYIPVRDAQEGLSYMMCSYCKGDRIYRVFQNFLRHMESGECPMGQQELLRLRSELDGSVSLAPSLAPPLAPTFATSQSSPEQPLEVDEAKETERCLESSFRTRRQLLTELRLLQPRRYATMAVDALGLLNRSIQELLLLLQRAREDPECQSTSSHVAAPPIPRKAQVLQNPLDALTDRLKSQGFDIHPLISFDQCRSEFLLREAKFLPRCGEGPARRKAVKRPCDDASLVPLDLV